MEQKKISYNEALAELEEILRSIEGEDVDIDALAGKVERASELIRHCRERLLKVEEQVKTILQE